MIKAINDVVVIERDLYAGAIIVNEKMAHGVIVSVGPGRWKASVKDLKPDGTVQERWYPTSLQVGQRVCFSLDKGEAHIIEGKHLVVMREDDIAGVIEENLDSYSAISSICDAAHQDVVNILKSAQHVR
jgi:co-chaperonin GroES (HSP10)